MPELPEVETLKNFLASHIVGQKIILFQQKRASLRYPLANNLQDHIEGATIKNINRIAKYINIELDNDRSIILHLGMSGRFTLQEADYITKKHDHIIISLNSGKQIVLNDSRRFGMLYCCPTDSLTKQIFLRYTGAEPLEAEFNAEYLIRKLAGKKTAIKTAIMDSRVVVGVGNIYASESLFLAKINPHRLAGSLQSGEITTLVKAIKIVLSNAIQAGGTTLRDFTDGNGRAGNFQNQLNVYGKAGKSCNICKTGITRMKITGRAAFFCSTCQQADYI